MQLEGNSLTGTIPPSLGSLIELKYIDLAGNKLAGLVPPPVIRAVQRLLQPRLSSSWLHRARGLQPLQVPPAYRE
jgi:hypothetical protein